MSAAQLAWMYTLEYQKYDSVTLIPVCYLFLPKVGAFIEVSVVS